MSTTYALKMPSNYVSMNEEEMEYLEGGFSISRSIVSTGVDLIAMAICPALAPLKSLGKAAGESLVKKYLPNLVGWAATLLKKVAGIAINVTSGTLGNLIFGNLWCLTSVGGVVGLAADYFTDKKIDSKVKLW